MKSQKIMNTMVVITFILLQCFLTQDLNSHKQSTKNSFLQVETRLPSKEEPKKEEPKKEEPKKEEPKKEEPKKEEPKKEEPKKEELKKEFPEREEPKKVQLTKEELLKVKKLKEECMNKRFPKKEEPKMKKPKKQKPSCKFYKVIGLPRGREDEDVYRMHMDIVERLRRAKNPFKSRLSNILKKIGKTNDFILANKKLLKLLKTPEKN